MGSPSLTFPFQSSEFESEALHVSVCARTPALIRGLWSALAARQTSSHTADHAQFQSASVSQTCCDCVYLFLVTAASYKCSFKFCGYFPARFYHRGLFWCVSCANEMKPGRKMHFNPEFKSLPGQFCCPGFTCKFKELLSLGSMLPLLKNASEFGCNIFSYFPRSTRQAK